MENGHIADSLGNGCMLISTQDYFRKQSDVFHKRHGSG
jgi:hypothetical protein